KDRLLAAAAALFAERGFHGTKIRDIAARARVNVAAGNYHYGSKKALYLAVLRAQFAAIRASLAARGATRSPSELARLGRRELAEHVTECSLGGMERLAAGTRRARRTA